MLYAEFRKNGQLLSRQPLRADLSIQLPDSDQTVQLKSGEVRMVGDLEICVVEEGASADSIENAATGETPAIRLPDNPEAFDITFVGDQNAQTARTTQGGGERKYFLSSARQTRSAEPGVQDPDLVNAPALEGYDITKKLGQGGMGAVWKATQIGTGREVAIKTMQMARISEEAKTRFGLEIEVTAQLDHPNIGRLYESRLDDHLCFYAMELIDGNNLEDLNEKGPKLSDRDALRLMEKVCRAVGFAHQKGIIHRDLKPGNIMLTRDREPKVVDFGLAKLVEHDKTERKNDSKLTSDGTQLGTPAYMSPEQVRADQTQIDTRSDVYALGVILYEMVVGDHPHGLDGTLFSLFTRIMVEEIRPPSKLRKDIPRDIEALLLKALAKNPADRYATAGEMADDIKRYLDGEPLLAQPQTAAYVLKKKILKHKGKFLLAAAFVVLSLIGAIASYIVIRNERDRAEDARAEAVAAREDAERQRTEAERQRSRADERFTHVRALAQVFIHDFDDALKEGPTKARALLVTTAGDYLKKLSQDAADNPDLLLDIGRAYRKVGEVYLVLQSEAKTDTKATDPASTDPAASSRLQEALASFDLSLQNLNALLKVTPDNPDALSELASTYQQISKAYRDQGNGSAAREASTKALDILRQVVKAHPTLDTPQQSLADSLLGTALLLSEEGNQPAAIQHYNEAISVLDAASANLPDNLDLALNAARARIRLANLLRGEGDSTTADRLFQEVSSILSPREAKDPTNTKILIELNSAYSKRGDLLLDQGKLDDALLEHRKTIEIPERLVKIDPKNVRFQTLRASGYRSVGLILQRQGKLDDALRNYKTALTAFRALTSADPSNARLAQDLTWLLLYTASAETLQNLHPAALQDLQEALKIITPIAKKDAENTKVQRLLVRAQLKLASSHIALSQFGDAQTILSDAFTHISAVIAKKDEPYSQHILSLVLSERARLLQSQAVLPDPPPDAHPKALQDLSQALTLLDAILKKSPDDQELKEDLARALLSQSLSLRALERYADASASLTRARDLLLTLDASNIQAQIPLIDALTALADLSLSHPSPDALPRKDACALLSQAASRSPQSLSLASPSTQSLLKDLQQQCK